jgi:hypothetical protein
VHAHEGRSHVEDFCDFHSKLELETFLDLRARLTRSSAFPKLIVCVDLGQQRHAERRFIFYLPAMLLALSKASIGHGSDFLVLLFLRPIRPRTSDRRESPIKAKQAEKHQRLGRRSTRHQHMRASRRAKKKFSTNLSGGSARGSSSTSSQAVDDPRRCFHCPKVMASTADGSSERPTSSIMV